jgi:SAM-dependent methyltransferase
MLHEWTVGDRWNPATVDIAVWECHCCGLVMLHPAPTPDQLPEQGEWWTKSRKQFRRNKRWKKLYEKMRYAVLGNPTERLIDHTHKAAPSGRLLDVGCGRGELLVAGARYYDCVGLEPSPVAAAEVRKKGFRVIEAPIEHAELERASFDVVTLDSVIEHVASPMQTLQKVNFVLRAGGVVVLKTPKFGGPTYRRHGRDWNGFRHGYHTYLFSGQTLSACLEQAGFEVLRRPRRDRILDDILILWARKSHEPNSGVAGRAA